MMKPTDEQSWVENVFAGDPPEGYEDWFQWASSKQKRGAYIRKAEPNDWGFSARTVASEWDGEGLPPVGEEVEASFVSGYMDQYWSKGKVVAHDNGLPVVRVGGIYYGLNLDRLRPLRTKEQRERDDLEYLMRGDSEFFIPDWIRLKVVDRILSRYNLEPKQ